MRLFMGEHDFSAYNSYIDGSMRDDRAVASGRNRQPSSRDCVDQVDQERTADMDRRFHAAARRRGRPSKFGRPSRVVALTLPEDAIDRLRRVHRDLGWAIVKLLDKEPPAASTRGADVQPDVELVTVADRRSLIVVNREMIRDLPGVNIIPLSGSRAFLALDIDRGMSDLELAVTDRLGDPALDRQERRALDKLRAQLRTWRLDQRLHFHTRAIIVVERLVKKPSDRDGRAAARGVAARRTSAKAGALIATPSGPRVDRPGGNGAGPERRATPDDPRTHAAVPAAELSTRKIHTLELHEVN
jgi:hypothetical protein